MANTFVFDDDESQPGMGAPVPESTEPEQPEGGEGNNRTFLIAAIALGGIVLLSLICMAVFALFILPGQKASAQATSEANLAAVALATNVSMETQVAALFTATLAPSETPLPLPTETPVVFIAAPTASAVPTLEPATATFEAMQTKVAENLLTSVPAAAAASATSTVSSVGRGTPRAAISAADSTGTAASQGTSVALGTPRMPATGFADGVGLPGLFVLSIILVAVILLARRLRQSPMAH
jgi:hypothetical protein